MKQHDLYILLNSRPSNMFEYNGKAVRAKVLPKDDLVEISRNFGLRKIADAENVSATIYAIESNTTHFVAVENGGVMNV